MRLTGNHAASNTPVPRPSWLSSPSALVAVIVAMLLVFELDRLTGSAPVQHLYYVPIILAGVGFRMSGGVVAALASILLYHLANPQLLTFRYEAADLVQILLFIAAGVVTARLTLDADRLRALAMTDDLTGLHNLRSFEAKLAAMIRAADVSGTPVAMCVLDLDRLKSLNDTSGHLAGAEAVRTVGLIIGEQLPPAAVACRYGGDEFAIALPGCTEGQAAVIAEGLRRAVHAAAPTLAGFSFPASTLSISAGVACRDVDRGTATSDSNAAASGEALFRAADAALYLAKDGGRNRVSRASEWLTARPVVCA